MPQSDSREPDVHVVHLSPGSGEEAPSRCRLCRQRVDPVTQRCPDGHTYEDYRQMVLSRGRR